MTTRAWKIRENGQSENVRKIAEELGVNPVIATLLVQRDITTFEQAKAFFRPELSMLYDPFLMNDMEKAVQRLQTAIQGGEKILVYGDYDVDGTTSVSMMYSFIKNIHPK